MYKRKIEPEKKIEAYQHEEGSAREIMKRLKISKASFQKWARNYNTFGRNGLPDKAKAKHYPKEVKTTAVQESLSGNTSLAVLCQKYKIYSPKPLRDWIKQYVGKKVMLSGVRQYTTALTDIAALRMNAMQPTKRSIMLRGPTVWCISSVCWQSFAESVQSIGVLSRK